MTYDTKQIPLRTATAKYCGQHLDVSSCPPYGAYSMLKLNGILRKTESTKINSIPPALYRLWHFGRTASPGGSAWSSLRSSDYWECFLVAFFTWGVFGRSDEKCFELHCWVKIKNPDEGATVLNTKHKFIHANKGLARPSGCSSITLFSSCAA